jgi:tetratricopeptide (TPR) repeat protein
MRAQHWFRLGLVVSSLWVAGCGTVVPQREVDACNGLASAESADQMVQACSSAMATTNGLDGPNTAAALVNRGAAHEAKGEMDAAISDFSAALQIEPDLAPAYADRAAAYLQNNDIPKAKADVDRAIALRPDDAKTRNLRCWLQAAKKQQLDDALADCNEALRLSPGNADYLDSLGFVQFRRAHYNEAMQALNAALQNSPGHPGSALQRASSLFVRSLCERRTGNVAAADADLASARSIDSGIERFFAGFGIASDS